MTSDPIRLLEDPTALAGVRGDLAHAAAAGLEGLDATAGAASLSTALLAESGAAGGAAASGGVLAKVAMATAAIAIVGGAAWALTRPQPAPANAVATSRPAPSVEPEARAPAGLPTPAAEAVTPAAEIDDSLEEDAAPPEEDVELPAADDAKTRPRKPRRPHHAGRASDAKSTAAEADRFAREATLVSDARRALGSNPGRALALTATAKKEVPKGMLVQEREAIAIRALVALKRNEDAKRRARAFLVKFGKGPHADSVRRATAGL